MRSLQISLAALVSTTLAPAVQAREAAPHSLNIENIRFNGTACRNADPSAVKAIYDGSQQKIIVTMKRADIRTDPQASIPETRGNCLISLLIRGIPGTQIAVTSQYFDGVAQMDGGVRTDLSISSFFSGFNSQNMTTASMNGPSLGVVTAARSIPKSELIWSGCDSVHELNIQVSMRIFALQRDPNPHTGSFYTRSSSGPRLGLDVSPCLTPMVLH
jgi:hypothetical protein